MKRKRNKQFTNSFIQLVDIKGVKSRSKISEQSILNEVIAEVNAFKEKGAWSEDKRPPDFAKALRHEIIFACDYLVYSMKVILSKRGNLD